MGNSTTKPKKRKKRVPNGQLTQLQNGSWQGRVCIGRSETGPIYQTITRQPKSQQNDIQTKWNSMMLVNIANSGRFAADRAINEYAKDIWNAQKI